MSNEYLTSELTSMTAGKILFWRESEQFATGVYSIFKL